MRRDRKGFTLIELVMVISILTILVSVSIPVVSKEMAKQKIKNQKLELKLIRDAAEGYFDDTQAFPAGMADLLTNSSGTTGWAGPYYDSSLGASLFGGNASPEDDAWGNAYSFTAVNTSSLRVISPGPDQKASSGDDISVTIDVNFIRRRSTLAELEKINAAVRMYNDVYLPGQPLPTAWANILSTLIASGYLQSEGGIYATDGWGNAYEPVPASGSPVVRIRSTRTL